MNSTPASNIVLEVEDEENALEQSAIEQQGSSDTQTVELITENSEQNSEESIQESSTPDMNRTVISPRVETHGARQFLEALINRDQITPVEADDENIRRSARVRTPVDHLVIQPSQKKY